MQAMVQWLAVLALVLPAPALAQAPTREALVGTWLRTVPWTDSTGKEWIQADTLVLHADSTWELHTIDINPTKGSATNAGCSGWSLSGDSFWFGPPAAPTNIHGHPVVLGWLPVKASLRGDKLTMTVPNHPRDPSPKAYDRIGDARPRPGTARCR